MYVNEGDMWFAINDSAVNIVTAEEVGEILTQDGCLLRYTKINSTEPVAMEIRDSGVEKPMSPRQL